MHLLSALKTFKDRLLFSSRHHMFLYQNRPKHRFVWPEEHLEGTRDNDADDNPLSYLLSDRVPVGLVDNDFRPERPRSIRRSRRNRRRTFRANLPAVLELPSLEDLITIAPPTPTPSSPATTSHRSTDALKLRWDSWFSYDPMIWALFHSSEGSLSGLLGGLMLDGKTLSNDMFEEYWLMQHAQSDPVTKRGAFGTAKIDLDCGRHASKSPVQEEFLKPTVYTSPARRVHPALAKEDFGVWTEGHVGALAAPRFPTAHPLYFGASFDAAGALLEEDSESMINFPQFALAREELKDVVTSTENCNQAPRWKNGLNEREPWYYLPPTKYVRPENRDARERDWYWNWKVGY